MSGNNSKLIVGDCMNVDTGLPSFEDNYFDLAVVDPPYGISVTNMQMGSRGKHVSSVSKARRRFSGGGKLKDRLLNQSIMDWDSDVPTQAYFDELMRVSRNQIIWGGNYFNLPPSRGFIIWNKIQPWDNFSQAEFAWTSFDCPAKVFTFSNRGGNNKRTKIHPTEKPIELYDYLFENFATEGYKILDTHLGSGNSRVSAAKAKLDFVGYEINEYFVEQHLNNWHSYTQHKSIPKICKDQLSIW